MSDKIALRSVAHEYRRWEVRIAVPIDMDGVSAGSWSASGRDGREYGVSVNAPHASALRDLAAALEAAAALIDERPQEG